VPAQAQAVLADFDRRLVDYEVIDRRAHRGKASAAQINLFGAALTALRQGEAGQAIRRLSALRSDLTSVTQCESAHARLGSSTASQGSAEGRAGYLVTAVASSLPSSLLPAVSREGQGPG